TCELERTLAAQPQPPLVMGHRREQDLAAEASVERVKVKLADRFLGDGIGLRVPPRRADELRQQPLVEVRISFLVALVEHHRLAGPRRPVLAGPQPGLRAQGASWWSCPRERHSPTPSQPIRRTLRTNSLGACLGWPRREARSSESNLGEAR